LIMEIVNIVIFFKVINVRMESLYLIPHSHMTPLFFEWFYYFRDVPETQS
jgi:hypothetical protein